MVDEPKGSQATLDTGDEGQALQHEDHAGGQVVGVERGCRPIYASNLCRPSTRPFSVAWRLCRADPLSIHFFSASCLLSSANETISVSSSSGHERISVLVMMP
jgi:hypothetical protein